MISLRSETLNVLDSYWATTFRCDPSELRPLRPTVIADTSPDAYRGIYAMSIGDGAPLCIVPPAFLAVAREAVRTWTGDAFDDSSILAGALGTRAGRAIGPAWIGYRDSPSDVHAPADTRLLDLATADDRAAIEGLRSRIPHAEWDAGGLTDDSAAAVGVSSGGQLVAIASYTLWGSHLAHIAIVTELEQRNQGFASAAVSRLIGLALERGHVPQFRTLVRNAPAMALAAQIGFVPYARSMAIRLRDPDT